MSEELIVYIDGVDFQHEIGEASGGNKVYPSLKDLKENNKCYESCGVVKAKITLVEWVLPQNIHLNSRRPHMESKIERAKERLAFFEEAIKKTKAEIEELEK